MTFFKNIITDSIIRHVFGKHLAVVEAGMINDNATIMNGTLAYNQK